MEKRKTIAEIKIAKDHPARPVIEILREELKLPNRQIKKIIATRGLIVGGRRVHSEYRVRPGQTLRVTLPEKEQVRVTAAAMDLDIIFEDQWLLAINKPAGINVHNTRADEPAALVNGVAAHFQSSGRHLTPRPVHRLDRDVSGIVLFAKDAQTQTILTGQWQTAAVRKTYWALAEGTPEGEGSIDLPVRGKPALTLYRLRRRYEGYSELAVEIITGRTHQIRFHLSRVGHPILGDGLYNRESEFRVNRLALHAERLEFPHPSTGALTILSAPVPDIQVKRADR